ncbi:MAG: TonB-dependent receptor [Gammaproteobacteria bacterium]|nr:TonB-dependent receptor [Gammaproteobacteria bacterium]
MLIKSASVRAMILILAIAAAPCTYGDAIMLPKLQVNSSKSPDKKTKHPAISAKFTKKQIKDQGASSASNFLTKQSLVQIKSQSPQQSQQAIAIHGFGANAGANTLLLLDGVPLTSFSSSSGLNLNSLLIENIDHILILPGSYGSLYGDQAVGGVVNFQTHVPGKRKAIAGFALGNHDQKQGKFFYSERFPSHIGVSLGGLVYHTDHYQPNNQQDNYNINAKVDYIGESTHTSLNILSYKTYIEMPNSWIWQQPKPTVAGENYNHIIGTAAYLKNKWLINNDWQWHTALVGVTSHTDGKFHGGDSKNRQQGILWQNSWHYKHYLIGGIDLQNSHYHSLNRQVDDYAAEQVGDIFGQLKIPLKYRLQLILAGRYAKQWVNAESKTQPDSSDQSGVLVNGQGLVWQTTPQLKFYLRRDTNYRFAKGNEKIWVDSNVKSLKTQTGTSYESGFSWHKAHNLLSLGGYWLDLNNELAYDTKPVAGGPFGSLTNLPPTRRLGVDMISNISMNSQTAVNLQLNAVQATFRSGDYQGNTIPDVSPLSTGIGLTYHNQRQWTTYISEIYHSAFYAADDLSNQGDRMPGYFLTNVNLRKQWQRLTFNLQVDNLFNKHYVRYADGIV